MYKTQTLRFNVHLDSKNLENYEISLLDLIKLDKPQIKNDNNKGEIDDMENLVKQMEEKYGPVAVVKGKRIRVNDFVDQGNGYDADDPFIDDSGGDEALVVAPDLMTEHGGFFINNERLKLNEIKFIIDRVEGSNDLMNSSKPTFPHKNISKKSKSQQLLSQARKRLTTSSKSVSSIRRTVTSENKKLDEIINDVVATKKMMKNDKNENVSKTVKKMDFSEVQVPKDIQEKEIHTAQPSNASTMQQTKVLELPTGLSQAILDKIQLLLQISGKCRSEGKKVEPHFNSILYELDTMLVNNNQKSMKVVRAHVFRYVSQMTEIKYDALLRRISKIKDSKKKQKMKPLFKAFEDAIKEAMVESVSKYDSDMRQYSLKIQAQKAMTIDNLSTSGDQLSEIDQETKLKTTNKIKLPKRCFKWSLACKSLLFKLVCGEMDTFRISNNKGAPEEYLNKFYQTSVVNFFPPKWMTVSQLMKISVPLIAEFKQCLLNGKEFKNISLPVKQKQEPKANNNLNGTTIVQLKEAVLSLPKCNSTPDLSDCKTKTIPPQIKKPIQPPPPLKTQTADVHTNNNIVKPATNVHLINRPIKNIAPSIHMKSSVTKHTVRSSSIIPPSRLNNSSSILAVKPLEATKRYSDGLPVSSHNTSLPRRTSENLDFNLIGLPSMSHDANNSSLSYLQNYLYSHSNDIEQIYRGSISNPSSSNNLMPHCSQQPSQRSSQLQLQHHQQHQQQQQQHQQHHHRLQQQSHHHLQLQPQQHVSKHNIQQHLHQPLPDIEFTHATPYNIVPDTNSRIPNRPQNIPDLSMIFSSPIERTQSNHHQALAIHSPRPTTTTISTTISTSTTTSNHCNLQPVQQQHITKPYNNNNVKITTDYDVTIKSGHPHYSLTNNNNSGIIDLTATDSTIQQQLSPSMFINMNKAHCTNARNYQN